MSQCSPLYADIFNAIPTPIFLVDEDVRILDLNAAASTAFGVSKQSVHLRRGGEALHCLHSTDVPEGCGRAETCKTCVIRNSVGDCLNGLMATRRHMKFEMKVEPGKAELQLLITATPLAQAGLNAVALIIEDIMALLKLRAIITICSQCKRVHNDQGCWQHVDKYFHDYGVNFSHGICPECLKKLYREYLPDVPAVPKHDL
jgi:PAS domain